MTLESGEVCHFRLQGNSEPVVAYLSGDRSRTISMEQIYGGLDPFTYHQVFTLSLDELQRFPGEAARSDEERLQAVLLGAGFAEIARLPGADAASGWMAAAHRYLLVHQALDVLETAAILGQAQGAQPQPRTMVAPQDDDAQPADGPVTSTVTS